MRFYLQYDSDTKNLDNEIANEIDLGLPKRNFAMSSTISNGGIVKGTGLYNGRVITFNKIFEKHKETERVEFLQWLNMAFYKVLWFYKNISYQYVGVTTNGSSTITGFKRTTDFTVGDSITGNGIPASSTILTISTSSITISNNATVSGSPLLTIVNFLGRTRVYPAEVGGETYGSRNFAISGASEFELYSENTYLTSDSLTSLPDITTTGTSVQSETVTVNNSDGCVPIFTFTPTADFTILQLSIGETFSVRIERTFISGEVIKITFDDTTLNLFIDDSRVYNAFSDNSSPFQLERGENTINIYATEGTLEIDYYSRRL